jgi:hypothetical protein
MSVVLAPEKDIENDHEANSITHLEQLTATGPRCWGPLQWSTLHQMLRGYPDKPTAAHKRALKQYVESLILLLPCSICGQHWKAIAPTVNTSSRLQAMKWGVDVHNAVNARLHKPVLSYAEAARSMSRTCLGNTLQSIERASATPLHSDVSATPHMAAPQDDPQRETHTAQPKHPQLAAAWQSFPKVFELLSSEASSGPKADMQSGVHKAVEETARQLHISRILSLTGNFMAVLGILLLIGLYIWFGVVHGQKQRQLRT